MRQKRRFTAFGECMIEFSRSSDPSLWTRKFSGDTFNTLWYFRHLATSEWATAYFTDIGDDAPSRDLLAFIENSNISVEFVRWIPNASPGLYLIELDEGAERHFSYWRENSAARRLATDLKRLTRAMRASDIIYFSGITLAILPEAERESFIAALATARQEGRIVAFDPNIRPRLWLELETMQSSITRAAATATMVFPTLSDEQIAFGDTDQAACADRYRALGAEIVVVKNGERPCLAVSSKGTIEERARLVHAPVDTTGAGDAFNAGFLAEWTASADIRAALRAAHATAAHVIGSYGALVPFSTE